MTLLRRCGYTLILAFVSTLLFSFSTPVSEPSPRPVERSNLSIFKNMTVKDFLSLTPKKYYELSGEKLSLPQKISLKIGQYKLKRSIRKGQAVEFAGYQAGVITSDFSLGGFLLGLVLPVVGVLIAYLIGDRSIIKWAWVGFAATFIIFLIAVLI